MALIRNSFTHGEPPDLGGENPEGGGYGEYASEYVFHNYLIEHITPVRTVRNVYVGEEGSSSTETDLVVLTRKGIFAVESKDYKGSVSGSITGERWEHTCGRQKFSFYSPMFQNRTHINALSRMLGVERDKFISYIVFSNLCWLGENLIGSSVKGCRVMNRNSLLKNSRKDLKSLPDIFTDEELDLFESKLREAADRDETYRLEHIGMCHGGKV